MNRARGEVLIAILYCGVCHSDIHQARDEWGGSIFQVVPEHEVVGRIAQLGDGVDRFKWATWSASLVSSIPVGSARNARLARSSSATRA